MKQVSKQTFKKYTNPIMIDGKEAVISVITEVTAVDVDGKEVILDRREEPIFGKTKQDLLNGATEALDKLKIDQASALSVIQGQIDQLNAL